MRIAFFFQRLVGYTAVLCGLAVVRHHLLWWQWVASLLVVAWGSFDQWKRPDAPETVMRRGILVEIFLIAGWSVILQDSGAVLLMLISPVARGSVHLKLSEIWWFGGLSAVVLGVLHGLYPSSWLALGLQVTALGTMGTYSAVLGALLRQRDALRRVVVVDAFEREQRAKSDERTRLAAQLHDTVGQYWTAVIRALDVALAVEGDTAREFMQKAREAASEGLRDTRTSVHGWTDGRQTPSSWMELAERSLRRLESLAGIQLRFSATAIEWQDYSDSDWVGELIARALLESVTNAVRHGDARTAWISIQQSDSALQVMVRDDGKGFDNAGATGSSGIGLKNLRTDAERLGGSFLIESMRGRGTTVVVRIPKHAGAMVKEELV